MASNLDFAKYVCDNIRDAGDIAYKKMFGEYAVYCDGKVIGLICDNQFFVKITAAGEKILDSPQKAPPYIGAKPYFVLDCLEDREFMTDFIRKTCDEQPAPKPKKKKQRQV